MRLSRNTRLLVEPPSVATGDIAFNLIIFFLVCASTQPDSGRKQNLPRSESQVKQQENTQNIEVSLDRTGVMLNAERVPLPDFATRLQRKLQGKNKPEDRIVVVRSSKDTPYHHWISVTSQIEEAGGTITIQVEEEKQVAVQ